MLGPKTPPRRWLNKKKRRNLVRNVNDSKWLYLASQIARFFVGAHKKISNVVQLQIDLLLPSRGVKQIKKKFVFVGKPRLEVAWNWTFYVRLCDFIKLFSQFQPREKHLLADTMSDRRANMLRLNFFLFLSTHNFQRRVSLAHSMTWDFLDIRMNARPETIRKRP